MTPHKILGLHFNATREDVVSAYRTLAKSCHPDLHPDDPDAARRFKELTEAYRILLEDMKKDGTPRHSKTSATRSSRAAPTVVVVRRNVFLTVAEAIAGCRKTLEGVNGACPNCTGKGKVPSSVPLECSSCHGSGIALNHRSGFINLNIECSDCSGTGRVTWLSCRECGGYGRQKTEACDIDIPPGVNDGEVLVVPGAANDERENVLGDVEITVRIKDRRFRIVGNDIETFVEVHLWQAVLGDNVEILLPEGEALTIKIPPETIHGTRMKIAGKGLRYTEEKGDMLVLVRIKPLKLDTPGTVEAMEILKRNAV